MLTKLAGDPTFHSQGFTQGHWYMFPVCYGNVPAALLITGPHWRLPEFSSAGRWVNKMCVRTKDTHSALSNWMDWITNRCSNRETSKHSAKWRVKHQSPPTRILFQVNFFLLILKKIFLASPCSMWDLRCPTRDQTCARCWKCRVWTTEPPGSP